MSGLGQGPGRLQILLFGRVVPVGKIGDEIQERFTQRQGLGEVQVGPADGIPEPGHDDRGILPEPERAIFLGRVGPEGRADHRPADGQRPARPPDVQCGYVAVADGLLPAGVGADLLYGQIDLDEALGVRRHGCSGFFSACEPTCSFRPKSKKLSRVFR